jgi:hypothetical protein
VALEVPFAATALTALETGLRFGVCYDISPTTVSMFNPLCLPKLGVLRRALAPQHTEVNQPAMLGANDSWIRRSPFSAV